MKRSGEWRVTRIRDISSSEEGNSASAAECTVDFSCASNDCTGGLETKVGAAAAVAARGIDVLIAKAGTEDALTAIRGTPGSYDLELPPDWVGTWLRLEEE